MTRKPDLTENSATLLLELAPAVLKDLRATGDFGVAPRLTVQQLRTLAWIERSPGSTLGQLASHLGIGLPGASASVSRLSRKGFLEINTLPDDRRSASLEITQAGKERVRTARHRARARVSTILRFLKPAELAQVEAALVLLKACYAQGPEKA